MTPITLDGAVAVSPAAGPDVLAVDEALSAFEKIDPRKAKLVELRYFAGLTVEETAAALDRSPRSVKRDWAMAAAWLKVELASAATA